MPTAGINPWNQQLFTDLKYVKDRTIGIYFVISEISRDFVGISEIFSQFPTLLFKYKRWYFYCRGYILVVSNFLN